MRQSQNGRISYLVVFPLSLQLIYSALANFCVGLTAVGCNLRDCLARMYRGPAEIVFELKSEHLSGSEQKSRVIPYSEGFVKVAGSWKRGRPKGNLLFVFRRTHESRYFL